jgi:hypothetical protein
VTLQVGFCSIVGLEIIVESLFHIFVSIVIPLFFPLLDIFVFVVVCIYGDAEARGEEARRKRKTEEEACGN